jgi:hypothetical protein
MCQPHSRAPNANSQSQRLLEPYLPISLCILYMVSVEIMLRPAGYEMNRLDLHVQRGKYMMEIPEADGPRSLA